MKKRNCPLPYIANKKSPLPQVKVSNIGTGGSTGNSAVDKLAGKGGDYGVKNVLNKLGRFGKFLGRANVVAGTGMFLKEAYDAGQEQAGGRFGYEKNPNYDPNKKSSGRHGDVGTNAEFIPKKNVFTGKETKHTSFWDNAKNQSEKNKKNLKNNQKKNKGFNFNKKTDYGV